MAGADRARQKVSKAARQGRATAKAMLRAAQTVSVTALAALTAQAMATQGQHWPCPKRVSAPCAAG